MSTLLPNLQATSFHVRMAQCNTANAWTARGPFTVPARFGDASHEALAARVSAIMVDISPLTRLRIHGAGAAKLLSTACACDLSKLAAGRALNVHWTNDAGGVRGRGVLARFARENFVLASIDADAVWFEQAATRFSAIVRDETAEKGMLLLLGPTAPSILESAGLAEASRLAPRPHGISEWQGLNVTVSRWGRLGGFEIACAVADGILVFDRIFAAGHAFALTLAGQETFDLLCLEAGIAIPGIDFAPARDAAAAEPSPSMVGLGEEGERVLAGVAFDQDAPAPFASVLNGARTVGRTMRSLYSPALRRAIALATLDKASAAPGTLLHIRRATADGIEDTPVHVVTLPFLG